MSRDKRKGNWLGKKKEKRRGAATLIQHRQTRKREKRKEKREKTGKRETNRL